MRSRNAAILTWIVTAAWSSRWKTGLLVPCRRKRIENRKVSAVGRWFSNDIAIVLSTSSESDRRWSVFEELAGCLADRCVRRGSLGVPSNRYSITIGSNASFNRSSTNRVRVRTRRLFRDSGADRFRYGEPWAARETWGRRL